MRCCSLLIIALKSVIFPRQVVSPPPASSHMRYLIQAVSNHGTNEITAYKSQEVIEGEFCEAASSLVNSGKQPLRLMQRSLKITKFAADSTRIFLQSLGNSFRSDDARRAEQMQESWRESIIAEMTEFRTQVETDFNRHGKEHEDAKVVREKAIKSLELNAHSHNHEAYLLPLDEESTKFLELGTKKDDAKLAATAHSIQDYDKIAMYHRKATIELGFLKLNTETLIEQMGNLLVNHVRDVDASPKYELKSAKDVVQPSLSGGETSKLSAAVPDEFRDSFDSEKAKELGSEISLRIASPVVIGDFEQMLEPQAGASPAARMDRLTTTLNALQIRKIALSDAALSIRDLFEKVIAQMEEQRTAILAAKAVMVVDLDNIAPLANVVVEDMRRYPTDYNVKIEDDENKDLYEEYKIAVTNSKNAMASVDPRTNLLVNVARRLHGHMLAFVSNGAISAGESNLRDFLIEKLGSKFVAEDHVFQEIKNKAPNEGNLLEREISVEPRKNSNCLLYGRYDVLMKHSQNLILPGKTGDENDKEFSGTNELSWCGSLHKNGLTLLEKISGEQSTQRDLVPPASEEKAKVFQHLLKLTPPASSLDIKKYLSSLLADGKGNIGEILHEFVAFYSTKTRQDKLLTSTQTSKDE